MYLSELVKYWKILDDLSSSKCDQPVDYPNNVIKS